MILSMGIGTLIGELFDFDKLVTRLGNKLEERFDKNKNSASRGIFAKGFVSCSLLFCVGAMTINGALADAFGKPDILLAKSVIDSFSVFVMSSTLGIGCAFAAFFLLIYQGVISLFGLFLSEVLSLAVMTYMSITGSLIIILIGTNVLGVTKVKTANMVPAMFMPILLEPLFMLILG